MISYFKKEKDRSREGERNQMKKTKEDIFQIETRKKEDGQNEDQKGLYPLILVFGSFDILFGLFLI